MKKRNNFHHVYEHSDLISMAEFAQMDMNLVYEFTHSKSTGLSSEQVEINLEQFGSNEITEMKEDSVFVQFLKTFLDPFSIILILLAIVSYITDVILVSGEDKNPITVFVILILVFISSSIRFVQERKSSLAMTQLLDQVALTIGVLRDGNEIEVSFDEVVVGDIIVLSAGDMLPADCRVISAKDLFVSQSSLTGESDSIEKMEKISSRKKDSIMDYENLVFMGSDVVSGAALAIVLKVGNHTTLGEVASKLTEKPSATSFDRSVNSISTLLIRFMLVMVPVVFFINGFSKKNWLDAFLFSVSIAVGLTPEMLPMIVTSCLAKGAIAMSNKKTVIKQLQAIQNFGAMDILCTDKTGTLTRDEVILEHHLNLDDVEDDKVLSFGYLNSFHQTGLKNLMDKSIIKRCESIVFNDEPMKNNIISYNKVDEIPFDFGRKRMSVVVENKDNNYLICKGAVEEMLSLCISKEKDNVVSELTSDDIALVSKQVEAWNLEGFRVIAVAYKKCKKNQRIFSLDDEKDLVLLGYLTFLDPPKESAEEAIRALHKQGIDVKVLTGDNDAVTRAICAKVGIATEPICLGVDVEKMTDEELYQVAFKTPIFAKLSPAQKARIIRILKDSNHTVGYMGDGINDALALKESDIGISVDTAVDISKEAADMILLEKDLMVLKDGIIEGRITCVNMIKYLKMTISSNFGNMFSVVVASLFLPFLPMIPVQLIVLNVTYDLSCTAIPWDLVDEELIDHPTKWDSDSIKKFMVSIGPISSIFDCLMFAILYFILIPKLCGGSYSTLSPAAQLQFSSLFQTGWFIASMWTQSLVIHFIRTQHIPFVQSRPAKVLFFASILSIIFVTSLPYTPLATSLHLQPLPLEYFFYLIAVVSGYMMTMLVAKKQFMKKNGIWI